MTHQALQSAARAILSVFAPNLAKIVHIGVRFGDFDTASTDGSVTINMPNDFLGACIPDDAPVTLGLLVHELGHWVQPLEAISKVEKKERIPGWASNILLDIHGESFIERFFPAMKQPLAAVRAVVRRKKLDAFKDDLKKTVEAARRTGWTKERKQDAVQAGMLISRFSDVNVPYSTFAIGHRRSLPNDVASAIKWGVKFSTVPPQKLPRMLRDFSRAFPFMQAESSHAERNGIPWGSTSATGVLGRAVLREAQKNMGGVNASDADEDDWRQSFSRFPSVARPEAVRLARSLSVRFAIPKGALNISAPGSLNRLDMARGAPVPFDMKLAGKTSPAPKIAIVLDASGSMFDGNKHELSSFEYALIAAQALALSLQETGDVKTAMFSNYARFREDDQFAFIDDVKAYDLFGTGTSFKFLRNAWRHWPGRFFIVLTDGSGSAPDIILPGDRERTVAVYIGKRQGSAVGWAAKTVSIHDIDKLASVFATLIPRRFTRY